MFTVIAGESGSLYTVNAELMAVGNAIEYSVLGEALIEADIYGPNTKWFCGFF